VPGQRGQGNEKDAAVLVDLVLEGVLPDAVGWLRASTAKLR